MNRKIAHLVFFNFILIATQGNVKLEDQLDSHDVFADTKEINEALNKCNLVESKDVETLDGIDHNSSDLYASSTRKRKKKSKSNGAPELELILKDDYMENLTDSCQRVNENSSEASVEKCIERGYTMVEEKLGKLSPQNKQTREDNYVSEDLYFHKVKILKIPLSYEVVIAFVFIIILAVFGIIYIYNMLSRRYCRCKLCTGVYEMGESLADGGFSSVFEAFKPRSGQKFVLKKIEMKDITDIDDLQFEAKTLIPLTHMNIVSYVDDFIHSEHGSFKQSYSYMIVMEFCNGGDLTDKIVKAQEENAPFTEGQIMEWFCQLCLAVKYIHSRNIIHRDIKSANLFLSDEHILKLGDFGLSTKSKSRFSKSANFSVVGTDCYMPPEVRDGGMNPNGSQPCKPVDIYCIGLVLFELVTLIPVYDLKFDFTIKLMTDPGEIYKLIDEISIYDRQISSIIKKCISVDPNERPNIDNILKKKIMKKYLRILEKNKGKYRKASEYFFAPDSESYSSQQGSEEYYSDDFTGTEHSFMVEGEDGIIEGKRAKKKSKRRNRPKKKPKKRSK